MNNEENKNLELESSVYDPNTITFSFNNPPEEILRINKEGFFWKGKLIEEDKEIYLRFKEWLDKAHALEVKSEPENLNNIKEDKNVIELLKEALKFYADENNYVDNHSVHYELFSLIEMDKGSQARFALKITKELSERNQKIEEDFVKNLKTSIVNYETPEYMLKIIEEFRKININDKNI